MSIMSLLPRFAAVLAMSCLSVAYSWQESHESVKPPSREFRAAWVASVHNIDWPSRSGMSADAQKSEIMAIINKAAELNLNALIVQVRPNSDALYQSPYEPWSQWLTGTSGKNPGYDPLQFICQQAHAKGIEVHAWFNPFRALANANHSAAANHISRLRPDLLRKSGSQVCIDPGHPDSAKIATRAILDVVKRYDVDGVHLDDYFYPYPLSGQKWSVSQFKDDATYNKYGSGGRTSWRRENIDNFVRNLYNSVNKQRSSIRVGISPFGIWRPGVPSGIEAGVDSYEHLAADSRKWLSKGWVDYLAPQLYWRCEPQKQSFPALLKWWREQSSSRPVFPGIATARIKSSEDPGRPASEIIKQINYTRQIGKSQNGMAFWSMKSLMQNKDGICNQLKAVFTAPALPPAMPWKGSNPPAKPQIFASDRDNGTTLYWKPADNKARKWVVQAKYNGKWKTLKVLPSHVNNIVLNFTQMPSALAVRGICPYGSAGEAAAVKR